MISLKKLLVPAFGLLTLAVVACGGGGGGGGTSSSGASTVVPQTKTAVTFKLHVATVPPQATAKIRKRMNEALNTQGLAVSIYPNPQGTSTPAASGAFDVSSGSTNCSLPAADTSRTCSFTLSLAAGSYIAKLGSYDGIPTGNTPTGTEIGIGSTPMIVTTGIANVIPVVINGIVHSVNVTLPVPAVRALDGITEQAIVSVLDPDNNVIVTNSYVDASGNSESVNFSASQPSLVTISPLSMNVPSANGVSVTYNPASITAAQMQAGIPLVITASLSSPVTSGTATLTIPAAIQTVSLAAPAYGITQQGNATLWVAEPSANQIQNVSPVSGAFSPIPVAPALAPIGPTPGPRDILYGPDGNLWMTFANTAAIGVISTTGSSESGVTLAAGTSGVSIASDGTYIWTAQPSSNYVEFTPTVGFFITQLNPVPSNGIFQIAAGTGGVMWFTASTASLVGIATAASPSPSSNGSAETLTPGSSPEGIAWDGNSTMWVAESGTKKIAQIIGSAPGATINEYSTGAAVPTWITVGADGNGWFDYAGPSPGIGRVTPNGVVSLYPLPAGSVPWQMVSLGSQIWVVDQASNQLFGVSI